MNEVDVHLRDVCVVRGGRTVLDVPELVVPSHSFFGVIGPNGAGKTTLLDVCAGLIRPARGEVRVTTRRVERLSSWQRTQLRRRIGVVPQRVDYHPDLPLTVREVVTLGRVGPRGLLRRLRADDHALVDTWLDTLELTTLARRTFRSLSGGEQQKVLIARAMVQQPRLLLLDEPASNLDLDWKERVVTLLEMLHHRHPVTVIMVSHEIGLLPACTDRVALMRSGTLLKVGPPEAVLTPTALSTVYACPVDVIGRHGRFHAVGRGRAGDASV